MRECADRRDNTERDYTHITGSLKPSMSPSGGNARVLRIYGAFAVLMGRTEAGIAAIHV